MAVSQVHSKLPRFMCSSFAGNTFADVVRHIGYVHSLILTFLSPVASVGAKSSTRCLGRTRHTYIDGMVT